MFLDDPEEDTLMSSCVGGMRGRCMNMNMLEIHQVGMLYVARVLRRVGRCFCLALLSRAGVTISEAQIRSLEEEARYPLSRQKVPVVGASPWTLP